MGYGMNEKHGYLSLRSSEAQEFIAEIAKICKEYNLKIDYWNDIGLIIGHVRDLPEIPCHCNRCNHTPTGVDFFFNGIGPEGILE